MRKRNGFKNRISHARDQIHRLDVRLAGYVLLCRVGIWRAAF
jgi:hypothetical protein